MSAAVRLETLRAAATNDQHSKAAPPMLSKEGVLYLLSIVQQWCVHVCCSWCMERWASQRRLLNERCNCHTGNLTRSVVAAASPLSLPFAGSYKWSPW
jgi:hypothetical protein